MQKNDKQLSALLVDSLALGPLRMHLKSRLDLQALSDALTSDYNSTLLNREIFFTYRPTEPRSGLHNWAFMHGWQINETRFPAGEGKLSTATDIGASISKLLINGIVQHIYVLANDLGLEPFFRLSRDTGVGITLIYPDDDNYHPYASLVGNVDRVVNPAKLDGVLSDEARVSVTA